MKSVLSSIDLICVLRELIDLKGAVVKKIYQVGDELLFHLYHAGEKKVLRVVIGKLIHLTSYVKENPEVPSNFCMYLRKYLRGAQLIGMSQPNLERIIVMRFRADGEILKVVFELFSSGNIIVTTDDDLIKQSLKVQRFAARTIRPQAKYILPPSKLDLSVPDYISFKRIIKSSEKDELVKAIAVDAGVGGAYAEEICLITGVDKKSEPETIEDDELKKCFDGLLELVKKAKYIELKPRVVLKGELVQDVTPFPLKIYEGQKYKEFKTFNEALDFFYARSERLEFEEKKSKIIEEEKKRINERVQEYEEHVQRLKEESASLKNQAFAIKNSLYQIENVISTLMNARKAGYSWQEIKERLEKEKEEGSSDAQLIKELKPDENVIVLDVEDGIEMPINVDLREFMDDLFEKAKKLEGKIEGAEEAVTRAKNELSGFKEEEVTIESNVPKKTDSSGKSWFEKFKWFRTSEDLLVISGRNAQQNEELIRRYLDPDDLVFHADIHGSPFTILKNGRKGGEESKLEAAEFTAAHSRAWSEGIAVDVYYVLPFQVTKEAPSGEYITTGGFMIKGKKEYYKSLKPELCLGVEEMGELNYRLISGPRSAVKKKSRVCITLEPGGKSNSEAVHELSEQFKNKGYKFDFETIKAAVPSGGSRITSLI